MKKHTVIALKDRETISDPLRDILRVGAQKLIQEAVSLEVEALLSEYAGQLTESGHAGVVLNGSLRERSIETGIGPVTVKIPKVWSRLGEHFPLCLRYTLYSENSLSGSGNSLVIFEGYQQW